MNYLREFDKECHLLSDIQGQLFEKASKNGYPSYFFVKVFMYSYPATLFDELNYFKSNIPMDEIYSYIVSKVKKNRGEVFDYKIMNWIGYFYRTYCYLYKTKSSEVFKTISPKYLKKAYLMYHTQDIRKAIQWVVEDLKISSESNEARIQRILRTIS